MLKYIFIQFSSVSQLCLTLCNTMESSMPGSPVHHQLPQLTQTHVHQVGGHEYYPAIKKTKNKIMPFATTWMDPEVIIVSEVNETKTNII